MCNMVCMFNAICITYIYQQIVHVFKKDFTKYGLLLFFAAKLYTSIYLIFSHISQKIVVLKPPFLMFPFCVQCVFTNKL